MIEKEKQITVERLIKVGRLASPFEKEREEANTLIYNIINRIIININY